MKRVLLSLMICLPMPALAAAPECIPGGQGNVPAGPAPAVVEAAPVAEAGTDAAIVAEPASEVTAAGVETPALLPCVDALATAPEGEPAYVPKTEHDNSPWRFDMNQNGKRMTAEEFDAWMKAKGIRVATGRPGAAQATQVAMADPSVVDPTVAPASDVPALVPVADALPVTPSSEALPAPAPALGAK